MRIVETRISAIDGTSLFVRDCCPVATSVKRTLVFVHGGCEHGGRYQEFAGQAVARRWRVLVPDLRGHGLSGGFPIHVARFTEYLADLKQILWHFHLDPAQTVLIGHSLGGLIVARYAVSYPEDIGAQVLLAPLLALRIPVSPWVTWSGRIIAPFFPRSQFASRIDPGELTRDPVSLQARNADPLIRKLITAGWYLETQQAMRQARKDALSVIHPLLVVQGGEDRIVDPAVTAEWTHRTGTSDKTLRMLPEHLHELLHEPDRADTAGLILDWLESRIPEHANRRM